MQPTELNEASSSEGGCCRSLGCKSWIYRREGHAGRVVERVVVGLSIDPRVCCLSEGEDRVADCEGRREGKEGRNVELRAS